MHSALLIDEILRQIFFFCSEHDLHSLVCAARSCKAWRDPALDFVWNRLSSLGPLLLLLPGISMANNSEYVHNHHLSSRDLHIFNSYARRVKHLSNRQETRINPSVTASSLFSYSQNAPLPSLETAHISIPRCNALLLPLSISPNLVQVDIDLGFKARASDVDSALCKYLERANGDCSGLRHLSLRGLASKRLNSIVSSMRSLHSLSLRLGHSLLPETLRAIISLPILQELEIHAGHIESYNLDESDERPNHILLPSLSKLHIRASSTLIENILQIIQPNTLHHLHIELDDPSPVDSSWNTISNSICSKTTNTLRCLALEHHFQIPEPASSMPSDTTQVSHQALSQTSSSIPFEAIEMLRGLKLLRHFSCDVTLPVIMTDNDVEKLVTWWPELEYLELGSAPQAEDQPIGVTQTTPASLALFASKCPKLRTLILPLAIGDLPIYPVAPIPTACQLHNLTIARLKTSDPWELAKFLHSLFPFLQILEGPCDDTQPWIDTNNALRKYKLTLSSY